jgi:hypothetical protein
MNKTKTERKTVRTILKELESLAIDNPVATDLAIRVAYATHVQPQLPPPVRGSLWVSRTSRRRCTVETSNQQFVTIRFSERHDAKATLPLCAFHRNYAEV